jgi:AraC-like DNA-binding protein
MSAESSLDAPRGVSSTVREEAVFAPYVAGVGAVLLRAARERWEPGSVCRAERLPFLALLHVRGGESLLRIQGITRRLRPGAVVALGGDSDHAFACPRTHLDIVLLNWGGDARERAHTILGGDTLGFAPRDPAAVAAAFDAVLRAAVGGGPLTSEICAAHLPVLLLTLRANQGKNLDAGASAQTFAACQAWIDAHLDEISTVAAIARGCHISHEHLCRTFRRHAGLSPGRYLLRRRLDRKAQLLATGRCSIKESALRCGYSDVAAFSRAFIRIFNVPPSSYRNQLT